MSNFDISIKNLKFARSKEARKRFDLRKRVILMIIVILASFVICWLPFHIDKLIEVANYEKSKNDASFYLAESFSNYRSDKVPCSRSDFQFKENSPSSGKINLGRKMTKLSFNCIRLKMAKRSKPE